MPYTILHISDLHAGPPFLPPIAEMLVQQAHELKPDVVVLSGDFVQRADFARQWRTILGYLERLPHPQMRVPGNHDVPLFNIINRMFYPLGLYSRHIDRNLNMVVELPGLALVGGCSAHGLTVAGGYLNGHQLGAMERSFARYGPEVCKVAVLHHPVVNPPNNHQSEPMINERQAVEMLQRAGVELVLSGHIHFFHVDTLANMWHFNNRRLKGADKTPQSMVLCCAGTTTSRRGRGPDKGRNSFNVITLDNRAIRVQPYFYEMEARRFLPTTEYRFERS